MPLFEIIRDHELIPFRLLRGGGAIYETEIETLLWTNLEEIAGEPLFPIVRQRQLPGGGKPDVIALDGRGNVVLIEVKRDVDRSQLAQCLEYAGWARTTGLDDLSRMYSGGEDHFFDDWQGFTQSVTPRLVSRNPRLILIAREFHGRTQSALEYLIENGVPVRLVKVAVYEDQQRRRFLDVENGKEPDFIREESGAQISSDIASSGRTTLAALIEVGLIQPGEVLTWDRPLIGQRYVAKVLENGSIELEDGRVFSSPSRAAVEAAGIRAYNGWLAWRVPRLGGQLLNDIYGVFMASRSAG